MHKARNIMERLPKPLHAAVRRALRQAWELDDAEKAEKLIRNLARRAGTRRSGRVGEHSGGPRRDPHRHATRPAKGTSPRARMHQHRGECHEHRASRLPQREAMAIGLDGPALDGRGHAGSRKRLPTIEGTQATSGAPCRSASASNEKLNSRRPCSSSQRRVTSTSATAASQCSTKSGTSPRPSRPRDRSRDSGRS